MQKYRQYLKSKVGDLKALFYFSWSEEEKSEKDQGDI